MRWAGRLGSPSHEISSTQAIRRCAPARRPALREEPDPASAAGATAPVIHPPDRAVGERG